MTPSLTCCVRETSLRKGRDLIREQRSDRRMDPGQSTLIVNQKNSNGKSVVLRVVWNGPGFR